MSNIEVSLKISTNKLHSNTTLETHITYNYHSLEWVWAEAALNTKLLSDSMGYLYWFEKRMMTPFLTNLLRKNSLTNSLVLPRTYMHD
jgi:hypothetical protein